MQVYIIAPNTVAYVLEEPNFEPPAKQKRPVYAWLVFGISFAGMIVCWLAWHSFGVFFVPLLQEFGWTRAVTTAPELVLHLVHGVATVFHLRCLFLLHVPGLIAYCGACH